MKDRERIMSRYNSLYQEIERIHLVMASKSESTVKDPYSTKLRKYTVWDVTRTAVTLLPFLVYIIFRGLYHHNGIPADVFYQDMGTEILYEIWPVLLVFCFAIFAVISFVFRKASKKRIILYTTSVTIWFLIAVIALIMFLDNSALSNSYHTLNTLVYLSQVMLWFSFIACVNSYDINNCEPMKNAANVIYLIAFLVVTVLKFQMQDTSTYKFDINMLWEIELAVISTMLAFSQIVTSNNQVNKS